MPVLLFKHRKYTIDIDETWCWESALKDVGRISYSIQFFQYSACFNDAKRVTKFLKSKNITKTLCEINYTYSPLGGVKVSVLAIGPKVYGFKPGRGDRFLTAIKIRSTPSFGGEVKPETPCRKILQHENKITCKCKQKKIVRTKS
jgi:hypothetical protein